MATTQTDDPLARLQTLVREQLVLAANIACAIERAAGAGVPRDTIASTLGVSRATSYRMQTRQLSLPDFLKGANK